MNRFYDLEFNRRADGYIKLTQNDNGEEDCIVIHPEQLLYVARQIGGTNEQAARIETLERQLSVLRSKLEEFVLDKYYRGEIIDRCGDGLDMIGRLDAILDLAWEFDGGLLPRELLEDTEPKASPASSTNNVTAAENGTAPGPRGQLGLPV